MSDPAEDQEKNIAKVIDFPGNDKDKNTDASSLEKKIKVIGGEANSEEDIIIDMDDVKPIRWEDLLNQYHDSFIVELRVDPVYSSFTKLGEKKIKFDLVKKLYDLQCAGDIMDEISNFGDAQTSGDFSKHNKFSVVKELSKYIVKLTAAHDMLRNSKVQSQVYNILKTQPRFYNEDTKYDFKDVVKKIIRNMRSTLINDISGAWALIKQSNLDVVDIFYKQTLINYVSDIAEIVIVDDHMRGVNMRGEHIIINDESSYRREHLQEHIAIINKFIGRFVKYTINKEAEGAYYLTTPALRDRIRNSSILGKLYYSQIQQSQASIPKLGGKDKVIEEPTQEFYPRMLWELYDNGIDLNILTQSDPRLLNEEFIEKNKKPKQFPEMVRTNCGYKAMFRLLVVPIKEED